jgi:hypothetical protein
VVDVLVDAVPFPDAPRSNVNGGTRNAIANWETAIKNIPNNQKVNLPV